MDKRNQTGMCRRCQKAHKVYVGRKPTDEERRKMSLSQPRSKHPSWKGNAVGYSALHRWVRKYKPIPQLCERCGTRPPKDLANKGVYDRNFDNWEYLCRACHVHSDGRIQHLDRQRKYILTPQDVIAVRERIARHEPCTKIAKDYGVNPSTIYGIKDGRKWRWLLS